MAKKQKHKGYLIFIDTNILLDFYRIRKGGISLKYLKEIENHRDKLILTSQVEMEFRKNRQAVILETLGKINELSGGKLSVPTILFDAKPVKMIAQSQKEIVIQQKKIAARIKKILEEPATQDKVFQTLQRVFKQPSAYYLDKKHKQRYKIRNDAKKRFILGYPPRKKNDTSIGDSLNWEWIVNCAESCAKGVIIVTRDSDYGAIHDGIGYLNDWLRFEFKERISLQRKIVLTDKLSKAFELVNIPVTDEMIAEEQKVIDEPRIKEAILNEFWSRLQPGYGSSGPSHSEPNETITPTS